MASFSKYSFCSRDLKVSVLRCLVRSDFIMVKEVTVSSFDSFELRESLLEWEQVSNTVRHQALGYVTSFKFLEQSKQYLRKEVVSPIT